MSKAPLRRHIHHHNVRELGVEAGRIFRLNWFFLESTWMPQVPGIPFEDLGEKGVVRVHVRAAPMKARKKMTAALVSRPFMKRIITMKDEQLPAVAGSIIQSETLRSHCLHSALLARSAFVPKLGLRAKFRTAMGSSWRNI